MNHELELQCHLQFGKFKLVEKLRNLCPALDFTESHMTYGLLALPLIGVSLVLNPRRMQELPL